jgi:L-threonylcarbamoyladenylate synthase
MSPAEVKLTDTLIKRFWPGPLTIILPKSEKIPDLVTSGLTTVGVRMPSHPLTQEFLKLCNLPIAAPSANKFGRISPTTATHVDHELGETLGFILDGGPCEIGLESTVIVVGTDPDTDRAGVWLVRPGKITSNDIEQATLTTVKIAKSEHEKASPGMLMSHYAPRKTMISLSDSQNMTAVSSKIQASPIKVGLLVPSGDGLRERSQLKNYGIEPVTTILLSAGGDDQEAAQRLFASMRELDDSDAELIIAGTPPTNAGLWLAISDRLKRACKY